MNKYFKPITIMLMAFYMVSSAFAVAPDFMEKMTSDARPEADRARDGVRRPIQVMNLAGVEEGMTVLDISSGAGWYARVLAAAIGPSGMIYAQDLGAGGRVPAGLIEDLTSMPNLRVVDSVSDVPANSIDVAVFGLESHHRDDATGVAFFREIYSTLKPGGTLVYTEYVGDPTTDYRSMHRLPIEVGRRWVLEAGFEILEDSDILRTSADPHDVPISSPLLGRNIDRFLFILRKPAM
jgi:predicted methyltransferase